MGPARGRRIRTLKMINWAIGVRFLNVIWPTNPQRLSTLALKTPMKAKRCKQEEIEEENEPPSKRTRSQFHRKPESSQSSSKPCSPVSLCSSITSASPASPASPPSPGSPTVVPVAPVLPCKSTPGTALDDLEAQFKDWIDENPLIDPALFEAYVDLTHFFSA